MPWSLKDRTYHRQLDSHGDVLLVCWRVQAPPRGLWLIEGIALAPLDEALMP
jgi:hypothetical protein